MVDEGYQVDVLFGVLSDSSGVFLRVELLELLFPEAERRRGYAHEFGDFLDGIVELQVLFILLLL